MMIAGPANCAAACPVMTKIPAPMMAPIPNVTRLIGPRARFRQCSPDSPASFISVSIGFVANKGLPMQLLLSESVGLLYPCPFGLQHCSGAGCSALQENSTIFRSQPDRKSTRLNSGHPSISYAVFCLKKKTELQLILGHPSSRGNSASVWVAFEIIWGLASYAGVVFESFFGKQGV